MSELHRPSALPPLAALISPGVVLLAKASSCCHVTAAPAVGTLLLLLEMVPVPALQHICPQQQDWSLGWPCQQPDQPPLQDELQQHFVAWLSARLELGVQHKCSSLPHLFSARTGWSSSLSVLSSSHSNCPPDDDHSLG